MCVINSKFIEGIVHHNAFEGCQKCTISGQRINRRTCFPRVGCPKRTDLEFRNRAIPAHHREYSIIEELPIDMVDDFVTSEDLHLLHLGIMKKLLLMWKDGDNNFQHKWHDDEIPIINQVLREINNDLPIDIHRSVRQISCLKFWKGTEFRTFLLYVGVVVLKRFLRVEEYQHFVKLFCAVTVCSTDKYFNKNRVKTAELARECFEEYIEEYIDLYGIEYVTSNVHNLSHIVDEVLKFGNLTKISAYCFENCLYGLKLRVRTCNRPLEQISRRIKELSLDYRAPVNLDEQNDEPILKYPSDYQGEVVYHQIVFGENLFLSSRNVGDKWFLTYCGTVVEFHFSLKRNNEYLLYGNCLHKKDLNNFFNQPISSKKINIFSMSNEECIPTYPKMFKLENVMSKLVRLRNTEDTIFIPLIHTLK